VPEIADARVSCLPGGRPRVPPREKKCLGDEPPYPPNKSYAVTPALVGQEPRGTLWLR
jgi:hypothetical protein